MTQRRVASFFPLRRGLFALGVSCATGLASWACVDVLDDAPAPVAPANSVDKAARADAELERLLVQLREGDDADRTVISTGVQLTLVGPGDTRPANRVPFEAEEVLFDGLTIDDLIAAATRRFGPGIADFGRAFGTDIAFVDHAEGERLKFKKSLWNDGTARLALEPSMPVTEFIGPRGPGFGFAPRPILGMSRTEIAAAFPQPEGALNTVAGVALPQTELDASLWVGYRDDVANAFHLRLEYGDDPVARLRILHALEAHYGVALVAPLATELETLVGNPCGPCGVGSTMVWDFKDLGIIEVMASRDE